MSRRLSPRPKRIHLYHSKERFIIPFAAILFVGIVGSYLVFLSSAASRFGGRGGVISHSVQPARNPAISQTCTGALNIALVADVSGSIYNNRDDPNEPQEMQAAFRDLVDDLVGFGANFSLTEFAGDGQVSRQFTPDTTTGSPSGNSSLKKAINQLGIQDSRGTNWTGGLTSALSTFDSLPASAAGAPKLLIIATDGDPTTSLDDAITEANKIKAAGIHILAIGLGPDPTTQNMETLSGTNVSDGVTNVSVNTDVILSDFSKLGDTLLNVISGGCPAGSGGIGNGGDGAGKNGNGPGKGGSGPGKQGNGPGTGGNTGTNAGTNAGPASGPTVSSDPTPTPTPSNDATQTTPTPTPTPNPIKAPSSAPTQTSTNPKPAPKPTAQGTQAPPPTVTPSPFYDGKQYAPGSTPDTLASTIKTHATRIWWYVLPGILIVLGGGGYLAWKKGLIGVAGAPKKAGKAQPRK